jgi:hypothetical protein
MAMETVWRLIRSREGAWGRAIVEYMDKKLCGYSVRGLAEYFDRYPVAMSRGIGKVEKRIGVDKAFEEKLRK